MNKTLIGSLIGLILLLIGCTANQQIHSSDLIKIGFIGALTGDAADYGTTSRDALEIALSEINGAGGVNGRLIQILWQDGKCNGKEANSAAQKLIFEDKVKIIIYGSCSGELLGSAPILEENKVIGFATYPSSPDITKAGDYIFRNVYSDADTGKATAQDMIKKYKTVSILSELSDYCQALKRVFVEEYIRLGGKVLTDEDYEQNNRDFRTPLLKIIEAGPEIIFLNPQSSSTGAALFKQLKELDNKIPLYTNFILSGQSAIDTAGSAAEGVVFVSDPEPNGKQKDELFAKYEQKYGKKPAYNYPVASTYDALYILAQALREIGYDADKLKEWLYKMPEYDGTLGKYHFDENGDVVGIKPLVMIVKNGKAERTEG
ncbi:MAG TPA: ABC transporter substrate-binding protein [Candidatus Nanoarchaeia archaeon]|nr:ABC transporter substrate-binding protein [Candidatus Nanoarchaeia archaeon]